MRILLSVVLTAVVLLAGCVTHAPLTDTPSKPQAPAPVITGKSNRFEMTQNGRRMSADDFDRWMKARGIRVAKGKQAATRSAKSRGGASSDASVVAKATPKASPKSARKTAAGPASGAVSKGASRERAQTSASSGAPRRTVR